MAQKSLVSFPNFPLPPSENRIYANNPRGYGAGRGRRYTAEMRKYVETCNGWYLQNLQRVKEARVALRGAFALRITQDFHLHHATVFSKAGKIKAWDVTNRLKALQDQVKILIQRDDADFFESTERKVANQMKGMLQTVDIVIEEMTRMEIDGQGADVFGSA